MKNQYFGDSRDLFKYDLLLDLVEAHGHRRLTLIPMLTPPDGSREGGLIRAKQGNRHRVIYEFLRESVNRGRRDIQQLRELMPQLGVTYLPYRDDRWFDPGDRSAYFEEVPADQLENSVIFLDPDTGLESGTESYMRNRGLHKYLKYVDLAAIWSRASAHSAVVVYQHLQRNALLRSADLLSRLEVLSSLLAAPVWAVQRHDLSFFVAAKDKDIGREMSKALNYHCSKHDKTLNYESALRPRFS